MVLEGLISPLKAEREPIDMLFIGILYSTVAILLSLWIFKEQSSLVMVFLTVMAALPLVVATFRMEEKKDLVFSKERDILKEHAKALKFLMYLFVGCVIGFSLWYVFLPKSIIATLFSTQSETIRQINTASVVGFGYNTFSAFNRIFLNNTKVLIFCILFSFIYGAGAIFILIWNASVIAAAIGNLIRTELDAVLVELGAIGPAHYFQIFSLGLMRYSIHGIPEILAYFIASLAGGIISVAAIKHDFGSKSFERIVFDSSELIIISVLMLIVSAFLEVYVTPLVF